MALPNRIHLSESNHEACLEDRQNPNRIVWPRQPAKSSSSLGHLPGSDGVDALSQPIFTRSQASGSRGMCRPKARASKRGVLPRVSGLHLVHWLSVRSYQKGQGTHLQRFVRARIGYVSGNGAAFSNIPPNPSRLRALGAFAVDFHPQIAGNYPENCYPESKDIQKGGSPIGAAFFLSPCTQSRKFPLETSPKTLVHPLNSTTSQQKH